MSQKFEQLKSRIEQRPCHICGGSEFERGYVDSFYQPELFSTKFDSRRRVLATRKCLRCSNVQMFVDDQSTKKARNLGCWIGVIVLLIAMIPMCLATLPFLQMIWMVITGQTSPEFMYSLF
jgi:hypothetical protein